LAQTLRAQGAKKMKQNPVFLRYHRGLRAKQFSGIFSLRLWFSALK
jgi:hypothetical protein